MTRGRGGSGAEVSEFPFDGQLNQRNMHRSRSSGVGLHERIIKIVH